MIVGALADQGMLGGAPMGDKASPPVILGIRPYKWAFYARFGDDTVGCQQGKVLGPSLMQGGRRGYKGMQGITRQRRGGHGTDIAPPWDVQ